VNCLHAMLERLRFRKLLEAGGVLSRRGSATRRFRAVRQKLGKASKVREGGGLRKDEHRRARPKLCDQRTSPQARKNWVDDKYRSLAPFSGCQIEGFAKKIGRAGPETASRDQERGGGGAVKKRGKDFFLFAYILRPRRAGQSPQHPAISTAGLRRLKKKREVKTPRLRARGGQNADGKRFP